MAGQGFSPVTPVSSTNKTDRHDITEILLKVALTTINHHFITYHLFLILRDMQTPINVLTGLDYWLDNLMSNVPEVAMCYHLNGIVQVYLF